MLQLSDSQTNDLYMCLFSLSNMKSNHILLLLAVLVGVFLITGCSNPAAPAKSTSDCHALDGTWKGVISDSGSLLATRIVNGEEMTTHNPFTAQYDFEMTIRCDSGDKNGWSYILTQVKASHPLFNCANGCIPLAYSADRDIGSSLNILNDGSGGMYVLFPNGMAIETFVDINTIQVSPDKQKLTLSISGGNLLSGGSGTRSIGWNVLDNTDGRMIETDNCVRLGGEGSCILEYINKNTIILNKIS
jgi:hypothetical protein